MWLSLSFQTIAGIVLWNTTWLLAHKLFQVNHK